MAWAWRGSDRRAVARTHGNARRKSKTSELNFRRNLEPDFTHYLSERSEMSSQDESSPKAKPTRKKNKMKQKKAKKTMKVRDLKPIKDVKGGYGIRRVR
jgi:hypothetical protein